MQELNIKKTHITTSIKTHLLNDKGFYQTHLVSQAESHTKLNY